jgi:hemolysin III
MTKQQLEGDTHPPTHTPPDQSRGIIRILREPVNSLTHFAGALLSVVGMIVLIWLTRGRPMQMVAVTIYGTSSILLYSASTLHHGIHAEEPLRRWLKLFDHAAIYVLIAGTYTPVTLIALQGEHAPWGWALFGAAWGFALLGLIFKLFWLHAPRFLSTGLYLLMGWLALVAIVPMSQEMSRLGLMWLALGGAFYSIGAVIYALKRPNFFTHFGYHEVWHLFVLAGSISHFAMIVTILQN